MPIHLYEKKNQSRDSDCGNTQKNGGIPKVSVDTADNQRNGQNDR
jgi:hypothetical protein